MAISNDGQHIAGGGRYRIHLIDKRTDKIAGSDSDRR